MNKGFTDKELRCLKAEAEQQYEGIKGARFYRNVDFLLYLCMVMLAALAIRAFFVEPIRVQGNSMTPTLEHGEHMLVEKISFWTREPERGEIVICFYPNYTESCVKRVIGLPGETLSIEGGRVLINGEPLQEQAYWSGGILSDMAPVTVGEKELFVMGDNRNGSKDSRSESVGCIPYYKVLGRVVAVLLPVDSFRKMQRIEYPT